MASNEQRVYSSDDSSSEQPVQTKDENNTRKSTELRKRNSRSSVSSSSSKASKQSKASKASTRSKKSKHSIQGPEGASEELGNIADTYFELLSEKVHPDRIRSDGVDASICIKTLTALDPDAPDTLDYHHVLVSIFVLKMENFDSANESCFVEFGLNMWWRDKNLIGKTGDEFDKKEIWQPDLNLQSTFKIKPVPEGSEGSWWILDAFSPYGIVNHYKKFRASVHVPLELQDFPFDQQTITLRIKSDSWAEDMMKLVNFTTDDQLESMIPNMDMQEFEILMPLEVIEEHQWGAEDMRDYSQLCLPVQLKRKTGYYLKNIIFLVFMISIMEWGVFFVDTTALDSRLSIGVTLFLAAVAFNFVIAEEIPKVSHSTYISRYFFVTYLCLMLSIVENVVASIIAANVGQDEANILDWVFLSVYGATTVIFTIVFAVIGTRKGKKEPHKYPPHPNDKKGNNALTALSDLVSKLAINEEDKPEKEE